MTKVMPRKDVVIVGFGWTGAIAAQELTDEGLEVLALERGVWRDTSTQYAVTNAQDEVRYRYRDELFESLKRQTLTFRNDTGQTALPMRRLGSFLPGTNVGGSGVHWNGQTWRFLPSDFVARSHNLERYGALPVDTMTIQDWGVTYDDLEPHYSTFEYLCGISGQAGNLNGEIQEGGNPFEGPRSRPYPNPPMNMVYAPLVFARAAREAGYKPFPGPSANMSQAYTNPLGVQLAPCTYCGFCEKYACGNYSKATASTTILPVLMRKKNFTLRTEAMVLRVLLDKQKRRATGVEYVTPEGETVHQPADIVMLGAYITQNVHLLLVSGVGQPYDPATGEGLVGKNYAYQIISNVTCFYDRDTHVNPYIGAGALGMVIDEFNGDNFDHSGLGFIGGGYIAQWQTNGRPIESHSTPEGTPRWGLEFKRAVRENYGHSITVNSHGAVMSYRGNYLDLDPTYRDVYGRPLMRMTFNFTDNERRMSNYLTDRILEITARMGAKSRKISRREGDYSIVPYQTTHNTGGHIMGATPSDSVTNRYNQVWDVPNLFLMGAGNFPQNPGYNPTGTVAALAYHTCEAIRSEYLRAPGPLVQA